MSLSILQLMTFMLSLGVHLEMVLQFNDNIWTVFWMGFHIFYYLIWVIIIWKGTRFEQMFSNWNLFVLCGSNLVNQVYCVVRTVKLEGFSINIHKEQELHSMARVFANLTTISVDFYIFCTLIYYGKIKSKFKKKTYKFEKTMNDLANQIDKL